MKKKLSERFSSAATAMLSAVKGHPVELIILLHAFFAVLYMLLSSSIDYVPLWVEMALAAPLAWGAAFSLQPFRSRRKGWTAAYWGVLGLYLLSSLFVGNWANDQSYYIAVFVVLPLWLLVRRRLIDNERFVARNGKSVWNLTLALFFGVAAYVLIFIIIESIWYIFKIEYSSIQEYFLTCPLAIIFVLLVPIFFTALEDRGGELRLKGFVAPLLNWVLTPALLIYTLVLYVYAAKVLFTWTLPEGGVAIMVFVFCIVCMLAKMLQRLVEKHPFRWFYRSFSWIALPLVLLFWVGTCHRIGEYGLTESRYNLLLCGALMTFYVLLFAFRNRRGYFIVTATALALALLSICLPPISAQRVSFASQLNRVRASADQLGILNADGTIRLDGSLKDDTIHLAECRRLYKSLVYLESNDTAKMYRMLGVKGSYDFLSQLSEKARNTATAYQVSVNGDDEFLYIDSVEEHLYFMLSVSNVKHDFYDADLDISQYSKARVGCRIRVSPTPQGIITINDFSIHADTLLARQLRKLGATENEVLDGEWFDTGDRLEQMLRYDDGNHCILFKQMELLQDGGDLQITEVWVELMLER